MTRDLSTLCLTFLTIFTLAGASVAQNGPVPVPPLLFPVVQGAQWEDTFGTPRDGHTHQGQDLMAPKMRPLIACFAGTVTLHSNHRTAGNWITLQGTGVSVGWRAEYMHLNNDTPGTNDGRGGDRYAFAPGLKSGDSVGAGQLLGYVGDSGNAESAGSHCHFELHGPDGPVNCALVLRASRILASPQFVVTGTADAVSSAVFPTEKVVGTVLTLFPDQTEAIVRVTSVSEAGGNLTTVDPPSVKRLVFSDKDAYSTLSKGILLAAEGKDQGQGKPLEVDRLTTMDSDLPLLESPAKKGPLPDRKSSLPQKSSDSIAPKNILIDGFERGTYQQWDLQGNCWNRTPEFLSDRLPVPGTSGSYYLSTAHPKNGDNRPVSGTGVALSSEFTLTLPRLRFRIGGGNYPEECCLNLLVDGKVVRTETGSGTDRLIPVEWDITEFVSKRARLQVVDKLDSGLRAYILLDEIEMFDPASVSVNTPAKTETPESVAATISEQTPGTLAFVLLPDGTKVEGTQLLTLEATGYGPGENGQWGDRTFLGTKVGYGTVAVDPKIIPLRTHLWVEGYGFCIALDTGSAIKGMKIDLGHDSDAEAATVGRKKLRVLILD
jgi:3D (Asp-Asp-Asp) domain-containing protein/murein DD-endopeptidase MepM/ murein hydrolase activator NlpD